MTESVGEPRDLDSAKLDAWLAAHFELPVAEVTRSLLSGGLSQQTLRYDTSDGRVVIVRIPPLHGPLEPYDPAAEAGVIAALGEQGLPVPEVAFVEPTGDVIGRPFFGTRLVDGYAVLDGARDKDPAAKASMGGVYADLLARIHLSTSQGGAESPSGAAIAGMPRKTPRAVLERWVGLLDGVEVPAFHAFIAQWLETRMPADGAAEQLVHGDYRLGNLLWTDDETASAVLDWEEAGLGDGYFDLGWALHAAGTGDDDDVMGLTSRRQFLDRYAAAVGAPVDTERLLWWEVLAAWARATMDSKVVVMSAEGLYTDVRAMLAAYRNRKLGQLALGKIIRYETARRGWKGTRPMDYIPDSEAIRAMTRSIVNDVIPRTDQGYPRGQLWAIVGLLDNLAIDLDNRAPDATISTIRPVPMTLGTPLEGDVLAQAQRHHDDLVALIARQAPLNSGRAVLGK